MIYNWVGEYFPALKTTLNISLRDRYRYRPESFLSQKYLEIQFGNGIGPGNSLARKECKG